MLRRLYGAAGHDISLANPAVPDVTPYYSAFQKIPDNVDDARVYGGIHLRFDQEAGGQLGRAVATDIYQQKLRRANPQD